MKTSNSAECLRKTPNINCHNYHDNLKAPLLLQSSLSWGKKVRRHFLIGSSKIIMLWYFVTGIPFSIFLNPLLYIPNTNKIISMVMMGVLATMFLFSPISGFLADVKFSRFKVLKCSTYIMLAATIPQLLFGGLMIYTVHKTGYYLLILECLFGSAVLLYGIGYVMFIANILQFGTSQLRDQPSQDSVTFLCWFFWTSSFGSVLAFSTHIPGHRSFIDSPHEKIGFDVLTTSMDFTLLCVSIVSSTFILFVLHKRETWFCTESVRENPYKLVCKVITFACRNKRPIHRSAFTYCEDKLPSRMDLGKLRYGGPFTTEQVEDVKVFLRIVMVLFSLGPAFLMDVAATASTIKQNNGGDENTTYKISHPLRVLFLDYGMLSPLLVVVCIPVYLSLVRPFFSRCIPNMMKRMGLGIALLCISFALLLAFDITNSNNEEHSCSLSNSYAFNKKRHPVHLVSMLHILSSLYHMLIYIAAWEFICSQSPQSMKGLFFGLFYAIRGFYQSLATLLFQPFYYDWRLYIISCRSGYYMLNLCVGLVSLLVYTVVARRYKYRKRDDICNTYQYAETYYSSFQ